MKPALNSHTNATEFVSINRQPATGSLPRIVCSPHDRGRISFVENLTSKHCFERAAEYCPIQAGRLKHAVIWSRQPALRHELSFNRKRLPRCFGRSRSV